MAYEHVFNPVLRRKNLEEYSSLLKKFNTEYDIKFKKLLKRWAGSSPEPMKGIIEGFHQERAREGKEAKRQMETMLEDSLHTLKELFGDSIKTDHQKNIEALEKKQEKLKYLFEESERKYPERIRKLGLPKAEARKKNAQERKGRMDDLKGKISNVKLDLLMASDQDKGIKKEYIDIIKNAKKESVNMEKKLRENFRVASPEGLSSSDKESLKDSLKNEKKVLAEKLEVINEQQAGSNTYRRQKTDILKQKKSDLESSYYKEELERRIEISRGQNDNKKAREKAKELAGKKRQAKVLARTQRSALKESKSSSKTKPAQKLIPEKTSQSKAGKFLEMKKQGLKKPTHIESKAKSKPVAKAKPAQKLIPAKTSQKPASKTGKFLETKKFELKKSAHTTIKAKSKPVAKTKDKLSLSWDKPKDKVVFDWDKPKDKLVFEKRQAKPAQKLISLKTKAKPAQKLISLKTKAKPTQKLLPEKTVKGETKKFLETKKFELKKPSSSTIKDKSKSMKHETSSGPDEDGFDIMKVLRAEQKEKEQKEKAILDKKEKLKKAKEARDFKYFMTGIGRKPAKSKKPTIPRERKGTSPVPGIVRMADAHYAKTLGWGEYKKKK